MSLWYSVWPQSYRYSLASKYVHVMGHCIINLFCMFPAKIVGAINQVQTSLKWVILSGYQWGILYISLYYDLNYSWLSIVRTVPGHSCVCVCVCVLTWAVHGVYVCLNVCIAYSHHIIGMQYPSFPWSKDYPHNWSVVEGAPSSRNQSFLGKAVCVLYFTWCTHSLSGIVFKYCQSVSCVRQCIRNSSVAHMQYTTYARYSAVV